MKRFGRYRGIVSLALLFVVAPLLAGLPALRQTASLALDCYEQSRMLARLQIDSMQRLGSPAQTDSALVCAGSDLPADSLFALAVYGGCAVGGYTPFPASVQGGIVLHAAEVTLCGDYVSLVRIVDHIERHMPFCKILSVVFRSVPRRESPDGKQLRMTLRIQCLTLQNS